MVGWIRGILDNFRVGSPVERREVTEERGKATLFDVTDGYFLVEEGRRLGVSWIQRSREDFRELRRRIAIRLKVKRNLSSAYQLPEIVDEVTEKIYTDSRENSRLKRMFG